jgi:polyhydroxyalkanoate synthesis regulator phasin
MEIVVACVTKGDQKMKLELTEEEFKEVVKEISNRLKDVIYMDLENKVEQNLRDVLKEPYPDLIEITWNLRMSFDDIKQIVGRLRRNFGRDS